MTASSPNTDDPTKGLLGRLARNLTAQSTSQVFNLAISVATTRLLGYYLTPAGFGEFKWMFAFVYLFQTLNDLGINSILIRDIAQAPEKAETLVRNMLGFKMLLAVASMLALWVLAGIPALNLSPRELIAVRLFSLILPIQAMTLPIVTLQAHVLIGRATLVEITSRLTGFALMLTAVLLGYELIGVTLALIGGELVALVLILATTRSFVSPLPSFGVDVWSGVLRATLPLAMIGVLAAVVQRIDTMLLQAWASPDPTRNAIEVGYYSAAYTITGYFERFPLLLMGTLYPLMSRMAAENPRQLRRLFGWSLRNLFLLAVPVVGVVSWLAPGMLHVLAGPGFQPAVRPLRILVWSTGFMYLSVLANNLAIALGQQRAPLRGWLIAAPANILLNFWLIPRYGASGAAFATCVSFFIVLCANLLVVRKFLLVADTAPSTPLGAG
jgi:O-antigen/teichoic acid export membrane protein